MRIRRPYTHILYVAEPLLAFHGISPICGVELTTALPVWSVQTDFRPDAPRPSADKLCPSCKAHASEPPAGHELRFYEYWLVEKEPWLAWLESRGKTESDGTDGED